VTSSLRWTRRILLRAVLPETDRADAIQAVDLPSAK